MSDLPSYVDYYGLNNDPFDEYAAHPFVPVAGRQKAVDTLLHLLQFSDDVIFIAGPVGSGKSAILEQLIRQLPENIDLVMIEVSESSSDKELLWDVATQFKLTPDRTHSTQRLQLMIQAHCQSLHARGQVPTLAIDDIDELPTEVLASLSPVLHGGLNGEPGLRLVGLAADVGEIRRELSTLGFASGQLIDLPTLRYSDSVNLIQGYFAAGGITSGVPFDNNTLKRLYKLSGGRPGRLLDAVKDFMLVETQRRRRHRGVPWPHMVAGAAIISALVLAVLYQSGSDEPPDTQQFELLASQPPELVSELDAAAVRERLAQAMAEREVITDPVQPEPQGSASAQPAPVQPSPPTPTTGSGTLSEDKLAELTQETAQSTTSTPAPTPAPAPPAATNQNQPFFAPDWLRNANNSRYTLQVLGARQEQNVLEFIAANELAPTQAGYYRTELQGQPWYVLVFGDYSNADSARAAITGLPANLRAAQPWPRPISSVKADLSGQ
ncbi:AAA family ATPase [Salinispirillum sp. LH 10-3-1]|uniref:AAA family ATPase n=1 Tax=Salinispirillum sp. LH 10-3-1 TaxID=2952525 RepID=A0AB38YF77_9GAMM